MTDSIALILAALFGGILGAALFAGLALPCLHSRIRARLERETWREAKTYFRHRYNIPDL